MNSTATLIGTLVLIIAIIIGYYTVNHFTNDLNEKYKNKKKNLNQANKKIKTIENLENLEIYNKVGLEAPIFSKACCGNNFSVVPGEKNIDPNLNKTYFASNITHSGDGNEQAGCRCLTLKEINYLNSRGGNNYDSNSVSVI